MPIDPLRRSTFASAVSNTALDEQAGPKRGPSGACAPFCGEKDVGMRSIALLLFVLAAGALALDAIAAGPTGFRLRSIGEVWYTTHRESWLLLQPAVERHIHQDLWFLVFEPFFRQPLAVVMAVCGLLVALLAFVGRSWRAL